eukprot:TRINITY_DN7284_c1_g5_i1.p1 TRINITY_DN7284_c1_g5~~TRINITY_DN7284_c1_g5_i1.p1  ORF type:complete len:178 (+),score=9.59 TRINITY_DN7284_c1_g5_i1:32-535(+)
MTNPQPQHCNSEHLPMRHRLLSSLRLHLRFFVYAILPTLVLIFRFIFFYNVILVTLYHWSFPSFVPPIVNVTPTHIQPHGCNSEHLPMRHRLLSSLRLHLRFFVYAILPTLVLIFRFIFFYNVILVTLYHWSFPSFVPPIVNVTPTHIQPHGCNSEHIPLYTGSYLV